MAASSESLVKIAIIGSGVIGPRHAKAVLQDPNASLHCIVDPNLAAESVTTDLRTKHYPSIALMLASPSGKPDAAIVCAPNKTHVALSKQLLSAGIHVLCEKPLSVDVPSGESLVAQARAHPSLHLLAGHHRRFNPYVVATKRILESKTHSIGQITAVSGLWTLYKPQSYFDPPTEWRRSGESGGPVWINLIHEIDTLHYLLGSRIVLVAAFEAPKRRGHGAEEGAAIILRFDNGVVGTFVLSDAVVSPHAFEMGTGENPIIPRTGKDVYRIFGTEGTLSVPDLQRSFYNTADGTEKSWGNELSHVTEPMEAWLSEDERDKVPFELQVSHFIRVIREGEKPVCSGEDGLAAVSVAEAIRAALRTGRVINVQRGEPGAVLAKI
jgi:predicted dehydrogenase